MARSIDLNCDLGEGGMNDTALMPWITSANIACGAHAGDEATMRATVALAAQHGVAVGAHPGFADRENFGRSEQTLTARALHELITGQIEALRACGSLRHVKPHGALYNQAARDRSIAEVVAEAVHAVDPKLILFALAGSELVRAGRARGLRVASEVFSDRTYQADGSLTPRSRRDALISDEPSAVAQVLRMLRDGVVRSTDGSDVPIEADTVCVHGDGPMAVAIIRRLHEALKGAGISVRRFAE
jgi:5-oxoprolinase (ATP-hydrolysing) subunit A